MIAVLSVVEVYRGHEEAFESAWKELRAAQARADGFHAARFFRDVDRPERYVVFSEWERRSDYDGFVRSVGVPWLLATWQIGPHPTVVVLEERA